MRISYIPIICIYLYFSFDDDFRVQRFLIQTNSVEFRSSFYNRQRCVFEKKTNNIGFLFICVNNNFAVNVYYLLLVITL